MTTKVSNYQYIKERKEKKEREIVEIENLILIDKNLEKICSIKTIQCSGK